MPFTLERDKKLYFNFLKSLGLGIITIEFDGGGDSGQIGDVSVEGLPTEDMLEEIMVEDTSVLALINRAKYPVNLLTFLQESTYDLLDETELDWVNNDGGSGTVTIIPAEESIFVSMDIRFTTSENHEFQLGFKQDEATDSEDRADG